MAKLPVSALATPPNVYFDDTGCNGKTDPYFMWVGFWGTYSFWNRFSRAWWTILDREPALPYWHQTEARARPRPGPFAALNDAQLRRREKSLCSMIADNAGRIVPIVVRVAYEDIKAHVSGKITLARPLTKAEHQLLRPDLQERPHAIALWWAAKYVVEANRGHAFPMPVSLYCESRLEDPYQDQMARIWKIIAAHEAGRMGDLAFVQGKTRKAAPLEAADMLAWHLNRRAKRPKDPDDPMWSAIGGPALKPLTISAKDLKEHVDYWNRWYPTGGA